jgi:hypothetical protein
MSLFLALCKERISHNLISTILGLIALLALSLASAALFIAIAGLTNQLAHEDSDPAINFSHSQLIANFNWDGGIFRVYVMQVNNIVYLTISSQPGAWLVYANISEFSGFVNGRLPLPADPTHFLEMPLTVYVNDTVMPTHLMFYFGVSPTQWLIVPDVDGNSQGLVNGLFPFGTRLYIRSTIASYLTSVDFNLAS